MDIEKTGEIIRTFLKEDEIQLVIELPAGSNDAEIKDNCRMVLFPQLYIIVRGLVKVFDGYRECLKEEFTEEFVDEILELIKEELMEER